MKYQHIYNPERFDLRDCYWEFHSIRDGEMVVRVEGVQILSGEDQGKIIEAAVVTFQGFRLTWFHLFKGKNEDISLSLDQARVLLADDSYLVFSYYCDDHECELAAVEGKFFAMLFSFDSVQISWDAFKERPAGTLIRT